MSLTKFSNTNLIKNLAKDFGFSYCGISKAGFLEEEAMKLDNWLSNKYQGSMNWMENNYDKRLDPTKLVVGSKSVISLLYNYYPPNSPKDENAPKLSKYAYGEDYHHVIKNKLKEFTLKLSETIGEFEARVFVDSAPVLERAWAAKSGLGWIGKNSMLITKKSGSFFFIAEIICDLDLEADNAINEYCGTCTACIDACPTQAILPNSIIDSNKCISYLTIELKEDLPSEFKDKMEGWVFGCDICQDVCPWNRFSKPHSEPLFELNKQLEYLKKEDWFDLTEEIFNSIFKKSAVKRTKFKGLKRNLNFIKYS